MPVRSSLLCLVVVIAACPANGAAPTECAESAAPAAPVLEPTRRHLNGTEFVPLLTVSWPFVTTQFGTTTKGGALGFVRRQIDPFAEDLGASLDTIYFAERLELQVALGRWVALRLGAEGAAVVPTTADTLFVLGTLAWWSGEVGAVAQLLRTRTVQLSLGLLGGASGVKALVPRRMLETLVISQNGVDFDELALVTDVQSAGLSPSLRLAWAPVAHLGLQASVDYDFRWVGLEAADDFVTHDVSWAAAAQYGLHWLGAPFAIPGAYRMRIALDADRPLVQQVETGLYYTGRPDLSLGGTFTLEIREGRYNYVGGVRMFYFW